MDKNIKSIFEDVCGHLKIDWALAMKIEKYRFAFVNKNEEHSNFFGGNLTGVHTVRFQDSDNDKWFNNILGVDERQLTDRCHAIIDPNFYKSASNIMSLSIVWLAHKFRNSSLSEKQKHEALVSLFQVLQYPVITSRLFVHFRHPANKAIAEATLAAMSNKYSIKTLGSWSAVLKERAEEIADPQRSIHRDTIKNMDIDIIDSYSQLASQYDDGNKKTTAYLINDTRNRLCAMMKNIYDLHLQQMAAGKSIGGMSSHVLLEGVEHVRDLTTKNEEMRRYLYDIASERNAFIKLELVQIIENSSPTMPAHIFESTLLWMHVNYNNATHREEINRVFDLLITHVLSYVSTNKNIYRSSRDIPKFITVMKGVYTSSRTKDPVILEIRDKLESITKRATGVKTPAVLSATRTGIWLYIILRVFTMSHYKNQ